MPWTIAEYKKIKKFCLECGHASKHDGVAASLIRKGPQATEQHQFCYGDK